MIFEQLYLGCLSQASYFIGDAQTGVAAVVDPRRDIDDYLRLAEKHGLQIQHVLLTHFHADFASGHLELMERCDATIYLGDGANTEYPSTLLRDGDAIEMGSVRLQALSTPGHTPESISILVFDLEASETEPHAVLTGDTLFIGDVGRPDLLGSVGISAEAMAGRLYDSLRQKLMRLPVGTMVYPGHGAGSMCGKNLSSETFSTIGEQLASNVALKPMEREEFVGMITENQPPVPAYFPYDAGYNKRLHPTLSETAAAASQPLSVERFLAMRAEGAQVLDTRDAGDYVRHHLHGSVNVGLGGRFATWVGTVLDADRPILLISTPGTEDEAILRLGRIGFDQVFGYLDGGMSALETAAELTATTGRVTAEGLMDHLTKDPNAVLLDVRTAGEHAQGAIEGSVLIPLSELRDRVHELPKDQPITIYCAGGYRSAIAMGVIQSHGNPDLVDLVGGWSAWQEAQS